MGVVFRQSFKGTLVTLLGAFVGFITTFFVITQLLTPEEIGLTRVLVEAATLIGGFALLATHSSSIRYYPYFKSADGRDGGFFKMIVLIPIAGVLLFGGLYLLLKEPLIAYFSPRSGGQDLFGRYYYYVLPLMLFIMFQTLLEVYCSLKQRIAQPKAFREVLLRLLLVICYLLYGLGGVDFDHFITLFVMSYGVMLLFTTIYTVRLAPDAVTARIEPVSKELKRDFMGYTIFTVLSALGGSIVGRLDLFMVSSQMGMEYAGIYTIAFFMVAVIEMPSRSLSSMSSPLASEAIHNRDRGEVQRLFRKVSNNQLLIGSLLLLLIWINIDTIFWIIPNSEVYARGKMVVIFLGLDKLVDLSFSFGNAILRYSKHYVWTLAYTIIVTTVTILLNLYFIEQWGMTGAAIATLIAYVISYAFQQWVLWRKMRITPINREMVVIFIAFLILILIDHILPSYGHPLINSAWRSVVIGIFGWWAFYKNMPSFRNVVTHTRGLFKM